MINHTRHIVRRLDSFSPQGKTSNYGQTLYKAIFLFILQNLFEGAKLLIWGERTINVYLKTPVFSRKIMLWIATYREPSPPSICEMS